MAATNSPRKPAGTLTHAVRTRRAVAPGTPSPAGLASLPDEAGREKERGRGAGMKSRKDDARRRGNCVGAAACREPSQPDAARQTWPASAVYRSQGRACGASGKSSRVDEILGVEEHPVLVGRSCSRGLFINTSSQPAPLCIDLSPGHVLFSLLSLPFRLRRWALPLCY